MAQQTGWEQPRGKSNKKVKPRNRDKKPLNQAEKSYPAPPRKQGKRKNNGKYNPVKNNAHHSVPTNGLYNGTAEAGGQYWSTGCDRYQVVAADNNTGYCYDPAWFPLAQDQHAYYPADACYGYTQYDPYATQMPGDYGFNVPATATQGSRLRAEAPEFIPTGQFFTFDEFEYLTRFNTPVPSEYAPMMDEMADRPAQRRYVTF